MPPRKVYGKSRAIYDPLAIFNSPVRRSKTDATVVKSEAATENLTARASQDVDRKRKEVVERKALGEVNVNKTALPVLPSKPREKERRKPKRLVVVEDSDEDGNENLVEKTVLEIDPAIPAEQPAADTTDKNVLRHQSNSGSLNHEDQAQDQRALEPTPEDESTPTCDQHQVVDTPLEILDTPASISPPGDVYTAHCSTLLELSSHSMSNFSAWASELSAHFNLLKIAEASFGEVYRLQLTKEYSQLTSNDESVFKIIPLKGPTSLLPKDKRKLTAALKKADLMSTPSAVANEVDLLLRMRSIPGYTNFRDVRVVKGRPPPLFINAFKTFNMAQKAKGKESSHFPDPSKKSSYSDDQLWAVIEMQDAGTDLEQLLESRECRSIWHVWDAFWQVTLSLAKGEDLAQFEHRDLHLGNICVRYSASPPERWDPKRTLGFTGVETTIIDYTISRAILEDNTTIAYQDLAAEQSLFEGDSSEEYQYDIYRYMRGALLHDDPYSTSTASKVLDGRTWEQYHPITNVLWLHYILHKFLENLEEWPSAIKAPSKRKMSEEYAQWKRAIDLEHVLLRVRALLEPGDLRRNELVSASHLVNLALKEGWIGVEDGMGVEGKAEESVLVERFGVLDVSVG